MAIARVAVAVHIARVVAVVFQTVAVQIAALVEVVAWVVRVVDIAVGTAVA